MLPRNFPEDINVELLLDYLPEGSFKVDMKGLHKRNAYYDILQIEMKSYDNPIWHTNIEHIDIVRNSIYNSLPEYLFHPVDRFNEIKKEDFKTEFDRQEKEQKDALLFFAPIDVFLLLIRLEVRRRLHPFTDTDSILQGIIFDDIRPNLQEKHEAQLKNRFIRRAIAFLPQCKYMRGNKTLLTILLRNIFMEEELRVDVKLQSKVNQDEKPRYIDSVGNMLYDTYVGNVYEESITIFDIHFWPEVVDEHFLELVHEIEVFREFLQDYFLSVEETLYFNITHDDPALRLSDNVIYNYLDYNTNI